MNEKSIKYLRKNVFKTEEYYQFELLFQQAREIEREAQGPVGILERAYIYNGKSIFSSIFSKITVEPIDYRPVSANERQGFQTTWIEQAGLKCQTAKSSVTDKGKKFCFKIKNKKLKTILIPNVVHHCRDLLSLIKGLKKCLPRLNKIYIFDSYIRECHQDPDDFCRYTPAALIKLLKLTGFRLQNRKETGNIFDCILYFISQAEKNLQYPENKILKNKIQKMIPLLKDKRKNIKYRALGRKHASAATAYAIKFEK